LTRSYRGPARLERDGEFRVDRSQARRSSQSASVRAIGFSVKTWMPRSARTTIISRWQSIQRGPTTTIGLLAVSIAR
jgi:hypothetical protein